MAAERGALSAEAEAAAVAAVGYPVVAELLAERLVLVVHSAAGRSHRRAPIAPLGPAEIEDV